MGAMADLDGSLTRWKAWPRVVRSGGKFHRLHPQITETVTVGNDVVLLDFNLYIETYVIEQAAEVVAKVDRSRDVYMENIKKKSAAAWTSSPASKSSKPATAMLRERSSAFPV